MSLPDPPDAPQVEPQPSTLVFQCVCGASVPLDSLRDGMCNHCGRRIRVPSLSQERSEALQPLDRRQAVQMTGQMTRPEEERPQESADPFIGRRLGYFRVIDCIGRGGMGSVYRALDESLQRYVALKVIRAENSTVGGGTIPHLLQEARAQARVHHPNVVTIYYVGRQQETPFLAMELVSGEALSVRMQRGRLPFGEIVDIAVQIASALRQAAAHDMVHGDIKPANILLQTDGMVKLSDFGLARRLSDTDEQRQTVSGTPNYLAPELCQGRGGDSRSDMYSLGVMLFEMTFRRYPYTLLEATLQNRLYAHSRAQAEFPDPWPTDLPEGWQGVLSKLLAKQPEDRYADYDELIDALERLRPVDLPKAGRFVRSLAWVVDLLLITAVQQILTSPVITYFSAADRSGESFFVGLLIGGLSLLAPLGFSGLQAAWSMTPGKQLLQIRIVDRYGLTPGRGVLFSRSFVQALPLWLVVLFHLSKTFHAPEIFRLLFVLTLVCLTVDAGAALLRKDGRALHDLFLGTRVVLDTVPSGADVTPRRRPAATPITPAGN